MGLAYATRVTFKILRVSRTASLLQENPFLALRSIDLHILLHKKNIAMLNVCVNSKVSYARNEIEVSFVYFNYNFFNNAL